MEELRACIDDTALNWDREPSFEELKVGCVLSLEGKLYTMQDIQFRLYDKGQGSDRPFNMDILVRVWNEGDGDDHDVEGLFTWLDGLNNEGAAEEGQGGAAGSVS
jgi:hypothetical protein